MAKGYYKKLTRILEENGCCFVRQGKGDHEIWYSPDTEKHIAIDVGGKSRHTANRILKDAGLDKAF